MLTILVEVLLLLWVNAFAIVGFYISTRYNVHPQGKKNEDGADCYGIMKHDKMVLWFVRYYSLKWFGEWYSKPVCECVRCMSSLHSIIPFVTYCLYTGHYGALLFYPFYILALITVVSLLQTKLEYDF